MVKFVASGEGGRILIGLGLEDENIKRLKDGEPIRIRLSDLGFHGVVGNIHIMIFTGKDAESITKDLSQFINSETVIHRERGGDD